MEIEHGVAGRIPYAALGSGRSLVICAGLWPTTGVDSGALVRGAMAPVRRLIGQRRVIVVNRRAGLPDGMSMGELAAEYAEAIRTNFEGPVDVLGMSTGGSIAQQLAVDHPDAVRRLVLASTACRLGVTGRELQAEVAAKLRAGRTRSAAAVAARNLAPHGLRALAGGLGWAAGRRVIADDQVADLAVTLEAEDGFDLAACSQTIKARTLIVAGGRDRFYGGDLVGETAALIPGSQLLLFPRRGHMSVTSAPRAQAAIAGFLTATSAPV